MYDIYFTYDGSEARIDTVENLSAARGFCRSRFLESIYLVAGELSDRHDGKFRWEFIQKGGKPIGYVIKAH